MARKKISKNISKIKNAADAWDVEEVKVLKYPTDKGGEGVLEIRLDPYVSYADRETAINGIADYCFLDGTFNPAMFDAACIFIGALLFTDIDRDVNIFELYEFAKKTDFDEALCDLDAYNEVVYEAKRLVDHRKAIIENDARFEKILEPLAGLIDKLADKMDGIDAGETLNAIKKINSISEDKIVKAITPAKKNVKKKNG